MGKLNNTDSLYSLFETICSVEAEENAKSENQNPFTKDNLAAFELMFEDGKWKNSSKINGLAKLIVEKNIKPEQPLLEKVGELDPELKQECIETLLPFSSLFSFELYKELTEMDTDLLRPVMILPNSGNKADLEHIINKLGSSDLEKCKVLAAQLQYDVLGKKEEALKVLESIDEEPLSVFGLLLRLEIAGQLKGDKKEFFETWVRKSSADVAVQSVARAQLIQTLLAGGEDIEAKKELQLLKESGTNHVEVESALWSEMWMNTRLDDWEDVCSLIEHLSKKCDLEWSQAFSLRKAQIIDFRCGRVEESNEIFKTSLSELETGYHAFLRSERQLLDQQNWDALKEVYELSKETQVFTKDTVLRKLASLHSTGLDDSKAVRESLAQIEHKTSLELAWFTLLSIKDSEFDTLASVLERAVAEKSFMARKVFVVVCALTRLRNGEYTKVLELSQEHKETFETNKFLKLAKAFSLGKNEDLDQGVSLLEEVYEAFENEKAKGSIMLTAGDFLEKSQPTNALKYYELSQKHHKDENTRKKMVQLYDQSGNVEASIREREKLLESKVKPEDRFELLFELGSLEEIKGEPKRAFRYYKEAYQINPKRENLFDSYKRCAKSANENATYKELLLEELNNSPKIDSTLALNIELAVLKEREGKGGEALDDLAALLFAHSNNNEVANTIFSLASNVEHWEHGGNILEKNGRFSKALELYQEVLKINPNQMGLIERFEKNAKSQSSWKKMADFYSDVLEQVRLGNVKIVSEATVLEKRARVYKDKIGDVDKALADLNEALKVDNTGSNDLHECLVESHLKIGDWDNLCDALDHWIEKSSFGPEHEKIIDGLLEKNDLPENVKVRLHEINLKFKTGDMKSLSYLDKFYSQNDDWDSLIVVLEAEIKKQDPSPNIKLVERAAKISEEKLHDEKKSIAHYQKLVELKPSHKRALDGLSRIYETTEKWAEFIEVTRKLTKAIKDKNAKAILFFKCGSVMEAKFGKENEAIRYYDAAIKTSPVCLPAVHGLRDLYLRRKDWPRVIQTLELEVKLWQDSKEKAGVFAQIGRIYVEELQDRSRGMHYYESALTVDPECVPANVALFNQYTESQQWERAKPLSMLLSKKMLRGGDLKTKSEFFTKKGELNLALDEAENAVESFVMALEIDSTNEAALEAFVRCSTEYPRLHDYERTFLELEKDYKKEDDGNKFRARIRGSQGLAAKANGDLENAERLLLEALELETSHYHIVKNLIELYGQMRQWPKAISAINNLLISDKVNPETKAKVHWQLFDVYANGTCQPNEAIKVLRRIAALEKNNSEPYFYMAQEQVLLEDLAAAKKSIEKAIEIATRPHTTAVPKTLSKYYAYLGQVLVLMGNESVAKSHLRRAVDYHPTFAVPSLSLAHIEIRNNDLRGAESRLLNAAHRIMELGQGEKAVPLQRSLAHVLERQGNTSGAIEAYRGILSVMPDSLVDRVSLSSLYKKSNTGKSNRNLIQGIEHSLKNGPLLDALQKNYEEQSNHRRLERVHSIKKLIGFELQGAPEPSKTHLPYSATKETEASIKERFRENKAETKLAMLLRMSIEEIASLFPQPFVCLLYTSPSPRDATLSRMPSSA